MKLELKKSVNIINKSRFNGDKINAYVTHEGKIKFHIHTNQPDVVKDKFKDLPEAESRVEDMEEQLKKIQKKPLGLVVDEVADLPREFLEKYDIEEVSFTTRFPDGEIITSKDLKFCKKNAKKKLVKRRAIEINNTAKFVLLKPG